MSQETLLYIMTGAVVVSAIAIVLQLCFVFGMYKAAKAVETQVTKITPKAESLVETTQQTVEQSKKQIIEITAQANEILGATKTQLAKIEEVLNDAASRAKIQMDRVELVLDDAVSRVQDTVTTVHNGIMRPLREVNGVTAGFRAALSHLMRGGRPSVAQATSDEEMFI
jgi:ElaB/YqjD/DUF883 family membrane-anchored ribosome-binding protein